MSCFVPRKQICGDLKAYLAIEWHKTHGKLQTEVSNSTRRHADNNGNHADLWPIKICHSTITQLNSIWNSSLFKLLQSMKCHSWTQVKRRQKWSSDRTENGKCTNVTNRRSRVGLSTPFTLILDKPVARYSSNIRWCFEGIQCYNFHTCT